MVMCPEQHRIRVAIYRGGTSKGVFFLENDLPSDPVLRDQVILAILGSPDPRQIDGLGGANSLTSKVAIVSRSGHPNVDVDYTFGQVSITLPLVDYSGNCGNISSSVGPFAVDAGLVKVTEPITEVRIFNTNTERMIIAQVPVVGGRAAVSGDCVIAGVPGSGAPIEMDFAGCQGAVTGHILPTGAVEDVLRYGGGCSIRASVVDASNPCIFLRAPDLGLDGTILPEEIDANADLLRTLEEIRSRAAAMIGLVDDWQAATRCSPAVPKLIVVSGAEEYVSTEGEKVSANGIDLVGRAMSMQTAHRAYPVTGAVCTGVAARLKGTVVNKLVPEVTDSVVRIGHPSGVISVEVSLLRLEESVEVAKAALQRTARRILTGYAYVPTDRLGPDIAACGSGQGSGEGSLNSKKELIDGSTN